MSFVLRRPKSKALALAAASTFAGLALTGVGVYAGLNAVATGSTQVNSGTVSLTMSAQTGSAGLSQTFSNMAPGDTENTYIKLTNSSTITAQNLSLSVTGSPSNSTLITPPAADGTTGLEVAVYSCSTAWTIVAGTPGSATCADLGGAATVIAATPVSTLASTPSTLVSGNVGGPYYYEVSLSLPNLSETTTNGTPPTSTIQNQTVTLNYQFSETQRAGTTTNA